MVIYNKDNDTLTVAQLRVYNAMKQFMKEHKYSPTFRELVELLGFGSTNALANHIKILVRKGHITKASNRTRSFVLCKVGDVCPCCQQEIRPKNKGDK